LSDEKKQQVVALGRLGWPLRRIEDATGVRRETASAYLKAAGVAVRPPRGWGRLPAKPANGTSTDPGTGRNPANDPSTDPVPASKPANEVSTDLAWPPRPGRAPAASACEPYREFIEVALASGRNAMAIWQDLVDDHGFAARYASVKRYVGKLKTTAAPEAHPSRRPARRRRSSPLARSAAARRQDSRARPFAVSARGAPPAPVEQRCLACPFGGARTERPFMGLARVRSGARFSGVPTAPSLRTCVDLPTRFTTGGGYSMAESDPGAPARNAEEAAWRAAEGHRLLIVGVGASAGGLEAFERFLRRVPPASGLAFVLVQHLDPEPRAFARCSSWMGTRSRSRTTVPRGSRRFARSDPTCSCATSGSPG